MATASPTPMGSSSSSGGLNRRPSVRSMQRQQLQHTSRPNLKRGSPVALPPAHTNTAPASALSRQFSVGDSSDDDIPVPMKFSALTKALLNDEASVVEPSSPSYRQEAVRTLTPVSRGTHSRTGSGKSFRERIYSQHNPSPGADDKDERYGSASRARVVRLSMGSGQHTLRRTTSTAGRLDEVDVSTGGNSPRELITPAPSRRIQSLMTRSPHSGEVHNEPAIFEQHSGEDEDYAAPPATTTRPFMERKDSGSVSRYPSTVTRNRMAEDKGMTTMGSSMRSKRPGKIEGRFMSAAPARRGRRRQSEEESPIAEDIQLETSDSHPRSPARGENEQRSRHSAYLEREENLLIDRQSAEKGVKVHFTTGSPPAKTEDERLPITITSPQSRSSAKHLTSAAKVSRDSAAQSQPSFKVPILHSAMPSSLDQENLPPPTFKRNKPAPFALMDKAEKVPIFQVTEDKVNQTPVTVSPQRKALGALSQNTPHRPAPPPPKMSVLETATATGGASSTAQTKKRRNHVAINGKVFTRMDCIGRGGSSRVYKVMAENYKIFALKKVTMDGVDELAVGGYKGEIDLLKRLEGEERVVRLYDYEMNDEKKTLSVVSEIFCLLMRTRLIVAAHGNRRS
jgi:serine/threonine-protein kinase TTK/MPS1